MSGAGAKPKKRGPHLDRARRRKEAAAHRATKPALKGREKHAAVASEIAERRRLIGRMHVERIPQYEIAERLKLDESTVSRDLKAIREEWRAEARSDVGEATERELKSLDNSEKKLRTAWDRILTARRMKPGLRALAECKLNAEITRLATHRAKLLGLEAPAKVDLRGPGGGAIVHDFRAKINPVAVVLDPIARELACRLLERTEPPADLTGDPGRADRAPNGGVDPGAALPGGPGALRVEGPVEAREAPRPPEPPVA